MKIQYPIQQGAQSPGCSEIRAAAGTRHCGGRTKSSTCARSYRQRSTVTQALRPGSRRPLGHCDADVGRRRSLTSPSISAIGDIDTPDSSMDQNLSKQIFDRSIARVRRGRARHGKTHSATVFSIDLVAEEVADRLAAINRDIRRLACCHNAEGGAPCGPRSRRHRQSRVDRSRPTCAEVHLIGQSAEQCAAVLDEEALPVRRRRSAGSLCFRPVAELCQTTCPVPLSRSAASLRPDGLFIGALLGGDTPHRVASRISRRRSRGAPAAPARASPPSPTYAISAALLQRAGFALPVVDADRPHRPL